MVHPSTIKYLLKFGGPTKLFKGVRFYLYDSMKKRKLDLTKEKIVNVNNYKMKTIPNDKGISTELLIYGNHEPLTTKIIQKEIQEGMYCLDLGSNIGYYALLESMKVGERGKVWAIEPSPENFSTLEYNIKLQNNRNIEAFNFAMGDINGEIEFIISNKSNWSKVRVENDIIEDEHKIIKVPVKTLDSFTEEEKIERIDLLRMDVEGYENKIIEGGMKFLERFRPKLMIEIHKTIMGKEETKRIFEKLMKINYKSKYFIPRIYDAPIIGNDTDIKRKSMNELINELENDSLPDVFQITLESNLEE